jgi:hypothetical protein
MQLPSRSASAQVMRWMMCVFDHLVALAFALQAVAQGLAISCAKLVWAVTSDYP